jgi:pyruvate/2-oxoglutarate dehydrogenase complex dihydrolipoamide dehydrogenase (E3) component
MLLKPPSSLSFSTTTSFTKQLLNLNNKPSSAINNNNSISNPISCSVFIIGGGSGGLACANELGKLIMKDGDNNNNKIILAEYVKPMGNQQTQWGIGGTCVNVGCIPKKLMHRAANYGNAIVRNELQNYGFTSINNNTALKTHDYEVLINNIQQYVKMLNFTYQSTLTNNHTQILDGVGYIIDPIKKLAVVRNPTTNQNTFVQASKAIVFAMGGRPTIPSDIIGAQEYGITSDDIFSITKPPGKTLVVGASYVALECASFIAGLGFPTTLSIRSSPLKGNVFDQDCAERILTLLHDGVGISIRRNQIPISINIEESIPSNHVMYKVQFSDGSHDHFNTILFGTGRKPETSSNNNSSNSHEKYLTNLVRNNKQGKIPVRGSHDYRVVDDSISYDGIYAIGDVADTGFPELTPIAIRQGEICAAQIAHQENEHKWKEIIVKKNPEFIPSTVFTLPSEYARIGLSEIVAKQKYGNDVKVYLKQWQNLEIGAGHPTLSNSNNSIDENNQQDYPAVCYTKLICLPHDKEKIVGLHLISPNASEAIQGLALAINMGATKRDLDELIIGIHPTDVESILGGELHVLKDSGVEFRVKEGCGGGRCG